ncbi:E3 ubiquitin-protein ligase znrf2-like isoform X1 [Chiloscyllium plagiosum]|uniref:E3 ubiquitin-protein ligase znrf2-like isoform X1 n=1 Tax=Chiloscyllium plagiosum TaxID=36176 RepID=UPI001CB87DF1|nr:E3 ubiquitin-protein ligase znrf2-like isoform X1 [Chiloscyllium plagiosum]
MGAKQSSPAPSGRTRAYSGSDLPSHTSSSSSNGSSRSVGGAGAAAASTSGQSSGLAATSGGRGAAAALSPSGRLHLVSPPPPPPPAPLVPPPAAGGFRSAAATSGRNQSVSIPNSGGTCSSQEESEGSTPEERTPERPGGHGSAPRLLIGSLPAHLSPHLFGGFKCPVCSKFVSTDEMDLHLVMCLTKPRVTYNEDVLSKDTGECAICLEELQQGDTIARLPCLCIYHKGCIDSWFEVNRSCPEHPSD